jgi:PIN domain nuclease of toxin-antitoxin system
MTTSTGYLLDSHVLLWWRFDPQRLPVRVLALLSDAETPIVVSSASVWELSIKHQQGKLLAAQAELEQLVLVRADSQLTAFPCRQLCEG